MTMPEALQTGEPARAEVPRLLLAWSNGDDTVGRHGPNASTVASSQDVCQQEIRLMCPSIRLKICAMMRGRLKTNLQTGLRTRLQAFRLPHLIRRLVRLPHGPVADRV